ncbi:MAG: hypothetical protein ABI821_02280 [Pseudomonadota bacterium]
MFQIPRAVFATASCLFISLLLTACGGGGGGAGGSTPAPGADTVAPTTTIDTQPAPLTPEIVATFTFSASESATFEASLDGAAFATAANPLTLTALDAGAHQLRVRARDTAGNVDATPATANWIIALTAGDETPPTTTIDVYPGPLVPVGTATFFFSSSEMASTFEASLDFGAFEAVTNPLELTGLAAGTHNLQVRARDAAGNVDPTPAYSIWIYDPVVPDSTPPTTSIDLQPTPVSATTAATFYFSSSEIATFEYSLDGAAYVATDSYLEITNLTEGAHELLVRAIDTAGNVDPTPASSRWIVSTPAPDTILFASPPPFTRLATATFSYGPVEPGSTFEARLDGAPFATVSTAITYNDLGQGTHTFTVRARNAAGIADPTPATYTWAVDNTPPSARIVFPTNNSYTDAETIAVRGNANDTIGVLSVTVNGVPAVSIDGYLNWRADVPLAPGNNALVVSVADMAGNTASNAASATVLKGGALLNNLRGMDYDPTGERVVAVDRNQNVVYGVPVANGLPQVISPAAAAGLGYLLPADLAVDTPRNRAILLDGVSNQLIAVDLTTGVRTTVSAPPVEDELQVADNSHMTLDVPDNRAFVTNPNWATILEIDLATGTRAIVSGFGVGGGSGLGSMAGIAYDDVTTPGTPRLLVSHGSISTPSRPERILAVDLATGVCSPLSSYTESVGLGTALGRPTSLEIDAPNHRLLVLDPDAERIMAVDLVTGERSVVDDSGISAGPRNPNIRGFAYDRAQNRLYVSQYPQQIIGIDLVTNAHDTLYEVHVGSGTHIDDPDSVVIEQRTGTAATLLLSSRGIGEVMRLNLASGARVPVANSTVGAGPDLYDIVGVLPDTRPGYSTSLALVAGSTNSLLQLDTVNGARAPIASISAPAPAPVVSFPRAFQLDATNNRVYLSDTTGGGESLYSIDLSTFPRSYSLVSGASRGTGPIPDRASNFVLEPADNPTRAILADEGPGGLYSVDLATGDRSLFLAPFAEDPLPGSSVITASFLDSQNSRILGLRTGTASGLLSIPLSGAAPQFLSGRDPVSGLTTGQGPVPYGCLSLDVDTTDSVIYLACPWISTLMMIDLVSGDRVVIGR